MAVINQKITEEYAIYNGDCIEVMKDLPDKSVGLSIYSPPFGGLYQYSSADEDLSNALDYEQFFEHYDFMVSEKLRVTKPGRMTCVHVAEVPKKGDRGLTDFPGDVIRQHQRLGWDYWARYAIWKEPLRVAIRTRSKGLMHKQIVKDSSYCNNAGADYLLVFRKPGESEPIENPVGLQKYCGERQIPAELEKFKNWKDPKTNKRAHWIWQQYASSFWDDIRNNHVLPYRDARESDEEKHVHPLQLDVIERCVILWSNPNDIVLTPFMGVGSEVYGALINGRRGIGIELKESYYRQAEVNIANAWNKPEDQYDIFDNPDEVDNPTEKQ
jgi:DNA modification methylase